MKDWFYSIGDWCVINKNIGNDLKPFMGKLVYIKDYVTSRHFDYMVMSSDMPEFRVKESALTLVPRNKLAEYFKINTWKQVVPKRINVAREVITIDFFNEKVYVKDGNLRYYYSFDEIVEYKGVK